MKIEDIDVNNVQKLSDEDICSLRDRCWQIYKAAQGWTDSLLENNVCPSQPIKKADFLSCYEHIYDEMENRDIHAKRNALDKMVLTRKNRGIDPYTLPCIALKRDVVFMAGDFARNSKTATSVDIFVDDQIGEYIDPTTISKNVRVKKASTNDETFLVPLYDLYLIPKNTIQDKSIEKKDDADVVIGFTNTGYHISNQVDMNKVAQLGKEPEIVDNVLVHKGIIEQKEAVIRLSFDANRFTVEQSSEWLEKNGYKTDVEPYEQHSFVKNKERHLVGGIVYAVDELDSDDEFVGTEEDIWKGMETWMLGGHAMKFMHKGKSRDVHPIEVFQADSATMKGGYTIPKGAWYVTAKVVDDDLWEACKSGEITGFSMAGRARAQDIEIDE